MDVNVSQLCGIFVNVDQFKQIEDDDDIFSDINEITNGAKYVLTTQNSSNETFTCKVFEPDRLKADQGSNDKKNQCWYRQLMLFREVIILKELRHPTIVEFKGFNIYNDIIRYNQVEEEEEEEEDQDYTNPTMFLEYLENKSLQSIISEKKFSELSPVKRQICMIGLASAVYFLHRKKILHRNLTPRTIWLDKDYYPKVFDFSSSRENITEQADSSKTNLSDKDIVVYQAPELLENLDYSFPVDTFALGRLLYFFLTGYEPFNSPDDPLKKEASHKLQLKIKGGAIPKFPEDAPSGLKNLLERCWNHNPSERPAAKEIYYSLIWEEDCQIVEFDEEIKNYIDKITKFEKENPVYKLEIMTTFEACVNIPEVDIQDDSLIPQSQPDQIKLLLKNIDSNFAFSKEKFMLDLLNTMAENETILKEDYLSKVINYVNDLSIKGNLIADKFINKVYGDFIVDPSKTTEIVKGTISNTEIKKINVPRGVTKIGKNAFSNFKYLERVNLPNTLVAIDDEAFSDCTNLVTINIPDSIKGENLGKGVFKNCKLLRYIKLPSELTTIKEATFKGNKSLSTVILGKELESIGQMAFYGCESIKYIEIPDKVTVLKEKAFYHCSDHMKVYFKGKKPKLEKKAFSSKTKTLS